ncbi:flagellar motility protein MotE (MotC chaperone) [Salirhabdus euzebyi]|uniref:Flagellar motility protein MotE (MotC chaperone) n=1 Tax=Salirhabdus euzebyi TaxID=394506 RepID=A0A841PXN8_9BACI|nr:hypothetical protein [Salirhabdus euzebyi]MBB6452246.1 flagellar motility protein MotE (MotC chaperone) [Salirhabdus euzebyi]
MALAYKKIHHYEDKVSKNEFEKIIGDLMDNMQVLQEKISFKADMAIEKELYKQRKEIHRLQSELLSFHEKVKQLEKQAPKSTESILKREDHLFRKMYTSLKKSMLINKWITKKQ